MKTFNYYTNYPHCHRSELSETCNAWLMSDVRLRQFSLKSVGSPGDSGVTETQEDVTGHLRSRQVPPSRILHHCRAPAESFLPEMPTLRIHRSPYRAYRIDLFVAMQRCNLCKSAIVPKSRLETISLFIT